MSSKKKKKELSYADFVKGAVKGLQDYSIKHGYDLISTQTLFQVMQQYLETYHDDPYYTSQYPLAALSLPDYSWFGVFEKDQTEEKPKAKKKVSKKSKKNRTPLAAEARK